MLIDRDGEERTVDVYAAVCVLIAAVSALAGISLAISFAYDGPPPMQQVTAAAGLTAAPAPLAMRAAPGRMRCGTGMFEPLLLCVGGVFFGSITLRDRLRKNGHIGFVRSTVLVVGPPFATALLIFLTLMVFGGPA